MNPNVNHHLDASGRPAPLCDACADALAAPLAGVGEPGLRCERCGDENPTPPPAAPIALPAPGEAFFIVLPPTGRPEARPLPLGGHERLRALQGAVGGTFELLSPAFHGLPSWDVYLNEDGADVLPENRVGCAIVGFDVRRFRPVRGPLVLVPRAVAVSEAARERQRRFFADLDLVVRGALAPLAVGVDFVIDARGAAE